MDLFESVQNIESERDFLKFLAKFAADVRTNPTNYQNGNLPDFLEAMAAWIQDRDGYYENLGQAVPEVSNWKAFADMLAAGSLYE